LVRAADGPFFVTYTHQMEEPGNLEIGLKNVTGKPDENRFLGSSLEFEYGLKGWWTTEVYLDGAAVRNDGGAFAGYRWENRFRVLQREHWINPVLYVEFENINGANRSLLETVNHDGADDLIQTVPDGKAEKKREIEAKLILSSYFKGWTIAENFIAEKNVRHEPYEFGYAVGVSRPLALEARPDQCVFCSENWQLGVEAYGGLGTHADFGFSGTSHYVAPTLSWGLGSAVIRVSPAFGVTESSLPFLLRVGVSYEISQFGQAVRKYFGRGR
jgi:hypothetical protein